MNRPINGYAILTCTTKCSSFEYNIRYLNYLQEATRSTNDDIQEMVRTLSRSVVVELITA